MGDKKAFIFVFLIFLIGWASAWADNESVVQNIDGCNLLNTTGAIYTLTENVSSTGTCFNITASNITLDCNGYWINYSIGGEANTCGIYTNQSNITVRNCNILDGNWTSSEITRRGIYLNGSDNSILFNNVVDVFNSAGIYLYNDANYNNLTSNIVSSDEYSGVYLRSSSNNIIHNLTTRGDSGLDLAFNAENNTITEVNTTGVNYYAVGIWIYYSNNNHFQDIDIYASEGYGLGVLMDTSNYSIFSNITVLFTGNTDIYDTAIYMYDSRLNNFTNIFINSTKYGMGIELSSNNNFSNIVFFGENMGFYLWKGLYNKFSNINITSNTNYGFSFGTNSSFNTLNKVNIISNLNASLYFKINSSSNVVANSTLISVDQENNLLELDSSCGFNTFYGNNFTNTSGYYVEDLNGSNYYNTTINGRGEGNIWHDIMNDSVNITGNVSSTLNPSLYIGEYGLGYPYNSTNSFGKISGNVVDYAPLTNQFQAPPEPPVVDPPSPGGGSSTSTQTQNNYQLGREFLEQGEQFQLRRNSEISFRHREQSHSLKINSFNSRTAKITIQSDPIIATLAKDIPQSFDIEGDGVEDIEVVYQGVEGRDALVVVSKLVLVSGESEVYVNQEGGEVQETKSNEISTEELFGTGESTSSDVEKTRTKTKHPLQTVLISLIVMGAIIAGLYAIGKNEKKKKDHYLGFFDN